MLMVHSYFLVRVSGCLPYFFEGAIRFAQRCLFSSLLWSSLLSSGLLSSSLLWSPLLYKCVLSAF